jgi:hypothetical protein
MAYSTVVRKREPSVSQLTRVMYADWGELISENWVRLSLALRLVSGVRQSWAIALHSQPTQKPTR